MTFADTLVRHDFRPAPPSDLSTLALSLTGAQPTESTPLHDRFLVRDRGREIFVPNTDVKLVEARGNYALLYTNGAKYMVRETMRALEARLDPWGFARVHRSAIVNLSQVREILPHRSGDHVVVMQDGTRLKLSRLYYARLARRIR